MPIAMLLVMMLLCLSLLACALTPMSQSKIAEQQASIRDMASQTLANLYNENSAAQGAVGNAAGYAVFSDSGFKLMFMGGEKGAGIAINDATKQETFMKLVELHPGLGLDAEKFRILFVFDTSDAFNKFVTAGREFGANAMAVAKTNTEGGARAGAVTLSEGVHMYQLTEKGGIVGVSVSGAKYYKDSELN